MLRAVWRAALVAAFAILAHTMSLCSSVVMNQPLDPAQLRAWRTFITAHATIVDLIEHDLAEAGQLPLLSYDVLLALVEAPNRCLRMYELAQNVVLIRPASDPTGDKRSHRSL